MLLPAGGVGMQWNSENAHHLVLWQFGCFLPFSIESILWILPLYMPLGFSLFIRIHTSANVIEFRILSPV